MAKYISNKISVKASSSKPLGNPPPGDKSLGFEPAIRFYDIEDGDENEKGEAAEILVVCDSSLAASKQNLVKRQFPYIDTFDHEEPGFINAVCNLTVRVFEHLEIISPTDMKKG